MNLVNLTYIRRYFSKSDSDWKIGDYMIVFMDSEGNEKYFKENKIAKNCDLKYGKKYTITTDSLRGGIFWQCTDGITTVFLYGNKIIKETILPNGGKKFFDCTHWVEVDSNFKAIDGSDKDRGRDNYRMQIYNKIKRDRGIEERELLRINKLMYYVAANIDLGRVNSFPSISYWVVIKNKDEVGENKLFLDRYYDKVVPDEEVLSIFKSLLKDDSVFKHFVYKNETGYDGSIDNIKLKSIIEFSYGGKEKSVIDALKWLKITTLGDLKDKDEKFFKNIEGFGKKSVEIIMNAKNKFYQ